MKHPLYPFLTFILLAGVSHAADAPPPRLPAAPPPIQAMPQPPVSSVTLAPAVPGRPAKFKAPAPTILLEVQDIPAAEIVRLIYTDVLARPFVFEPAVEADRAPVSARFEGLVPVVQKQATDYLAALGFGIVRAGGIDRVGILPDKAKPPSETFVYRPLWRSAAALSDILRSLLPDGHFAGGAASSGAILGSGISTSATGGAPGVPGSSFGFPSSNTSGSSSVAPSGTLPDASVPVSSGTSSGSPDLLVYSGTHADILRLQAVLPQIDVPEGELLVRASVFEVDLNDDRQSAFSLASALLKSQFSIGIDQATGSALSSGTADASGAASAAESVLTGNFIHVHTNAIDAVVTALSDDGRFHLITSPAVRARSGASTSFTVGQQVPVLGSVSYSGNGNSSTPVQSINYEDSGVIFRVQPVVRDRIINLDLHQEISDFVATTTGVNSTPTLTKRSLDTSLSVRAGDVILLGGLTEIRKGKERTGFQFLPDFLQAHTSNDDRTDVLLVLQVLRLDNDHGSPTTDELNARQLLPVAPIVNASPDAKDEAPIPPP